MVKILAGRPNFGKFFGQEIIVKKISDAFETQFQSQPLLHGPCPLSFLLPYYMEDCGALTSPPLHTASSSSPRQNAYRWLFLSFYRRFPFRSSLSSSLASPLSTSSKPDPAASFWRSGISERRLWKVGFGRCPRLGSRSPSPFGGRVVWLIRERVQRRSQRNYRRHRNDVTFVFVREWNVRN